MYDIRVESKPLYHHQFHHDHIYSLSYNPIVENVIASGMTFFVWMDGSIRLSTRICISLQMEWEFF